MNSEYIRSVMIDATEQMHKANGAGVGTKALNLDTVSELIAIAAHAIYLQANLEAGTRELRAYVEGNGFKWIEEESTVFNVTTALGWMGGTIQAYRDNEAK